MYKLTFKDYDTNDIKVVICFKWYPAKNGVYCDMGMGETIFVSKSEWYFYDVKETGK